MTRQNSFLFGAMILTVAGLLSRFFGVLYRIPFARLVGAEGIGLYQMAYPIYTTVLALSTAGLPIAISILVAEKNARGDRWGGRQVLYLALVLLATLGAVMSYGLYHWADWLAFQVLHDRRAMYSILAVSPAVFFGAVMSAFRGYFQGLQWMMPTGVSQVVEQLVRVGTVLTAALLLMSYGVEFAAAGAAFGAVAGGAAGLITLLLFYTWFCMRDHAGNKVKSTPREGMVELTYRLLVLAVPASLGALVMPVVQTLDAVLVPLRLQVAGFTVEEATGLYGELSGMAGTLINLPTIITTAITTSLVPAISEAAARGRVKQVGEQLSLALRASLLLCLPAAVGMWLLAEEIMHLLYNVPTAGVPLKVLAPSIVFLGMYQVSAGALQGLGRTMLPVRSLIIGAAFKIFLNYYLTVLPGLGIRGPAIGTNVTFLVAATLNFYSLFGLIGYTPNWVSLLLKPGLAVTIMGACVIWANQTLTLAWALPELTTLAVIAVGMVSYGVSLLLVGGLTTRELGLIPWIGPRLANVFQDLRWIRG